MAKLFENSVLNKVYPFLTFLQISGLQYFSVKEKANPKKWQKIHPKYLIYFVILASLVMGSCVGQFMQIPLPDHVRDSPKIVVRKGISRIFNIGFFLTASTILVQSITKTAQNKMVFSNFDKIAALSWSKTFYTIDYDTFQKQFKNKLIVIIIAFTVPLVMTLVVDQMYPKSEARVSTPVFVLVPIFLIKFAIIKYIFYIDLIHFHLLAIKKVLRKPCLKIMDVSDLVDNFKVAKDYKPTKYSNEKMIERIVAAKQMYGILWETTQLLNDCVGWSLLMFFAMMTFGLVVNGYQAFTMMQKQEPLHLFISQYLF